MGTLILIRHGQSQWNLENRFTGWTDVPLSERGEQDAHTTGKALKDFRFDCAFTSRLQRAQRTLNVILEETGQKNVPVIADSALNERHYGDLQGLNKSETAEKYGVEQVELWRRSYDVSPPGGESIAHTAFRVLPFFLWTIMPEVYAGKTVLVTASANSMRPIFQKLDNLDDRTTARMGIELCTPFIYTFEGEKLVKKETRVIEGIITNYAVDPGKKWEKRI